MSRVPLVVLDLSPISEGSTARQALQNGAGFRPLHGDHARRQRLVVEREIEGASAIPNPINDLRAIAGIDDHGPAVRPAIDEHVVADAAGVVAHQAVAGLEEFGRQRTVKGPDGVRLLGWHVRVELDRYTIGGPCRQSGKYRMVEPAGAEFPD